MKKDTPSAILDSLLKTWRYERRKMTVHRQQQLKKLLSKYDGVSIPIAHFRKDHRSNHKLRNAEAYPVVKALEYDILERTNDFLRLRDGMILGEKDLP